MKKIRITEHPVCAQCHAAALCLPAGLKTEDLVLLDEAIKEKRLLKKGDILFEASDEFKNFYAVSDGALKTLSVLEDGREQVQRFYFEGEIIGLDAVDSGFYEGTCQALSETLVCIVPFDELLETARQMPDLQRQLLNIMSYRLRLDRALPHNSSAKERLAAFLLNLSQRLKSCQASQEITLPMSRADIGNHLGLAVETVSRTLSELHEEGVLSAKGKTVKIACLDELKQLANSVD